MRWRRRRRDRWITLLREKKKSGKRGKGGFSLLVVRFAVLDE